MMDVVMKQESGFDDCSDHINDNNANDDNNNNNNNNKHSGEVNQMNNNNNNKRQQQRPQRPQQYRYYSNNKNNINMPSSLLPLLSTFLVLFNNSLCPFFDVGGVLFVDASYAIRILPSTEDCFHFRSPSTGIDKSIMS
jgi:hypothetical protein